MSLSPEILVDGLHFPEGPRWRVKEGEGKLWFSDMLARKVMTVDLEGRVETVVEVPEMKTLFMCESAVLGLERHPGDGRIRVVEVDVPGTGSP